MREVLLAGNWKMNKTISESIELAACLKQSISGSSKVIIFPPFTALTSVYDVIKEGKIELGAQNMYFEEYGSFTGEVSPLLLADVGVRYVILGHSERRHIFGEDDILINKKVKAALKNDLRPILCVGETLVERQEGLTENVIERQLIGGLDSIMNAAALKVIVAYEPVWAIGTGINAKPEEANSVHKFIRNLLNKNYGENLGEEVTILYGGSINSGNIEELGRMEEIDGGLVGGASLDCRSFIEIYKKLERAKSTVAWGE